MIVSVDLLSTVLNLWALSTLIKTTGQREKRFIYPQGQGRAISEGEAGKPFTPREPVWPPPSRGSQRSWKRDNVAVPVPVSHGDHDDSIDKAGNDSGQGAPREGEAERRHAGLQHFPLQASFMTPLALHDFVHQ